MLFLRSPVAHARIRKIDTSQVGRTDDLAVFTRKILRGLVAPSVWSEYPLAETEVVYQGQPVAGVVGSKRSTLEDSLERISVKYEPLPVVSEPVDAISGSDRWLSTASSNIVLEQESEAGQPAEALNGSPHTLNLRFHLPRISPYPLEGRGIIVERGRTALWSIRQPNLRISFSSFCSTLPRNRNPSA